MMERKRRFVALFWVLVLLVGSIGVQPGSTKTTEAASNYIEYYFGQLSYLSQWGVSSYQMSSGALKSTFSNLYGEIKYKLPKTIKASDIASLTVGANTAGKEVAYKFYDASGNQLFVAYNCKCSNYTDFSVPVSGSGAIASIGVMSQSSSSFTATTYNIKATLKTTSSSTLKGAMSGTFGKVGVAMDIADLQNTTTLNHIKEQYNSITLGNEMKPDYVLGWVPKLITVEEAKNKGYIIPDYYGESNVPELDFTKIDTVLKSAYENGLSVRFHTLVWHRQTPTWFFKYNFNADHDYCNSYWMDKRLEYYIKNVVAHISTSPYADVVYAYDVVNEYLHNTDSGTCHWTEIYGEEGTTPAYVKAAFKHTSDMLYYYGIRDKVKLFYNDYNTYLEADNIVKLIQFINGDGKLCDGIGMQTHLDVDWPDANFVGTAIDKFSNAGFEIQITELDATINYRKSTYTLQDQADYYAGIIKMLREKKANGANITGVTFWGLSDANSWRGDGQPLLYSTVGTKKPAFDAVINAMK